MQSLMWIQGILHHGASPDLYVLGRTPADFFQPLIAVSAGLTGLGLAPYLALMLWKPVAVASAFFVARAYVRKTIPGRWPRRAALALALFFAWGTVIGDSWLVWWSWGYPFALIGLACAVAALLLYANARAAGEVSLLAPLFGALASWLHPWQGETLILILIGSELALLLRGDRVALRALALTVAVTSLPLGYFALLVHFDGVWRREREDAISTYSLAHVARSFAPIALPALLAYRRPPANFIALSARVWPLAAMALFFFSEWQGSGPTHALLGITIPLAVLAVEGVCSLPWKRVAGRLGIRRLPGLPVLLVALIALLTVPGTISALEVVTKASRPRAGNADFITPGESEALHYIAGSPRGGGVLTRFYLGMVVPAETGRQTYVGNCYWSTPDCRGRSAMAEELLFGRLRAAQAVSFVRASGARFVLGDCRSHNLTATLAAITAEVHRFGCAAVYVVR